MDRNAHDMNRTAAIGLGLCATLAGIGLARFAYTPLIPALVQAHWFGVTAADYLGAANLLGYLVGAFSAHGLSERWRARSLLRLSFALVFFSFAASAFPLSYGWMWAWRLLSGVAGGWLMVVGPSMALTCVAPQARRQVGGLIFTGIGIGALLASLVVPLLVDYGLHLAWLCLAGLAAIAWLAGELALARLRPRAPVTGPAPALEDRAGAILVWAAALVIVAYAGDAFGFVPHTVFWVDYLQRDLGLSVAAANRQWALFGVGAVLGPFLVGPLATRIGWRFGLAGGLAAKALAVLLALSATSAVARTLSSLIVGAMVPGVVALTSGRLAELVGLERHKRFWGYATGAFAGAQALAGYGLTALHAALGSYRPLFLIAALVLAAAALLAVMPAARARVSVFGSRG